MSLPEPHEQEAQVTLALHELLAGRTAPTESTRALNGDVKACLDALGEALQSGGLQAVRKAFTALAKDRPWLMQLASRQPPGLEEPASTRRIRFVDDDAFESRPQRHWLIPYLVPKSGLVLVYGPPGCGKSFLTMAWSLCIASGTQWLGHPVTQGPVAYIAAEGSFGIGPRIKAWKAHHGYVGNSGVRWFDESLTLTDSSAFDELVTALKEDFPQPPLLVVIDTLSRCSAGIDENNASEIARFLACADVIQQTFHCTILIVHHEGKDTQRGPRGSSALKGNTETVIGLEPTEEGCKLYCVKQKDIREFEDIYLKKLVVRFGTLEEDTSVVLLPDREPERAKPLQPESQTTILACLAGKQLTYDGLKQACLDAGQKEGTFKVAFRDLNKSGQIVKVGKCWQLATHQDETSDQQSPEAQDYQSS